VDTKAIKNFRLAGKDAEGGRLGQPKGGKEVEKKGGRRINRGQNSTGSSRKRLVRGLKKHPSDEERKKGRHKRGLVHSWVSSGQNGPSMSYGCRANAVIRQNSRSGKELFDFYDRTEFREPSNGEKVVKKCTVTGASSKRRPKCKNF